MGWWGVFLFHSIMSPVYYQNRMLGAKDFATHDKCILPDLKKMQMSFDAIFTSIHTRKVDIGLSLS